MTTKAELRNLVAQLLTGATDAGAEVYTPGSWATHTGDYPVILVTSPEEEAESTGGRGTVEFTTVATIRISGRARLPAGVRDEGAAAEAALDTLEGQIKRTVINNPAIVALTSQTAFIRSRFEISAEGAQPLGEVQIDIGLEFYQGPEDFYDPAGIDLDLVAIGLTQNPATTEQPIPGALVAIPQE